MNIGVVRRFIDLPAPLTYAAMHPSMVCGVKPVSRSLSQLYPNLYSTNFKELNWHPKYIQDTTAYYPDVAAECKKTTFWDPMRTK